MSKITFTEDHISAASGNSFYTKGTQADLRGAKTLIDLGVARDGWGATGGHVTAGAVHRMIDAPILGEKPLIKADDIISMWTGDEKSPPDLSPDRKYTATKSARALAKKNNLLLYSVVGTGKNGKILLSNVEALIA